MTWNKDHAKFKMAAILLHQSLFLSWFILAAGSSPCARIDPRAPPTSLHSGTILIRGLLWVKLAMLPKKKNWGAIWVSAIFQNYMPQRKSNFDNISCSNLNRIIILLSMHMFSWSKNRIKPLIERLGHSYVANSETNPRWLPAKIILWQNHYIENQIILANILYK